MGQSKRRLLGRQSGLCWIKSVLRSRRSPRSTNTSDRNWHWAYHDASAIRLKVTSSQRRRSLQTAGILHPFEFTPNAPVADMRSARLPSQRRDFPISLPADLFWMSFLRTSGLTCSAARCCRRRLRLPALEAAVGRCLNEPRSAKSLQHRLAPNRGNVLKPRCWRKRRRRVVGRPYTNLLACPVPYRTVEMCLVKRMPAIA